MNKETKTDNLIYKVEKVNSNKTEKIVVSIRLNDECKNGHEDFSITCDGYERRTKNNIWRESFGGSAHDEILKYFPEFQIFVDLHLCDANGANMFAAENGFYHLKQMKSHEFCKYFRCNYIEYQELILSENENHFCFIIESLELPKQWLRDANKAIKVLEGLTGKVFESTAVKSNFKTISADQKADIKQKLSDGYFSPKNKADRLQAKKDQNKKDLINSVKASRKKVVEKAEREARVKLYFISLGVDISNMIYYTHSNTIKFNWLDYEKYQMSEKEFKNLCDKQINLERLPTGIKLQLGDAQEYTPI